jgi:hypothetical protein
MASPALAPTPLLSTLDIDRFESDAVGRAQFRCAGQHDGADGAGIEGQVLQNLGQRALQADGAAIAEQLAIECQPLMAVAVVEQL